MRLVVPRVNVPALAFLGGVLALWELSTLHPASANVPTPGHVAAAFAANLPSMLVEIGHTLARAGIGLALAIVLMIPLGVVLGRFPLVSALLEPIVDFLRTLPPLALVPIAMIFAGTGDAAKIAVIFYGASFPILLNTIDAVRGAHPMLHDTARALRLTQLESMTLIDAPAATPQIMAGIRTSVSISLLVSVTAEMLLSTNGIGVFILRSQENFKISAEIAGIVLVALVSWLINEAYQATDRRLLRWHHQTTGDRLEQP
jgi:NitT/TauT family transport system permease protein